MNTIGYLCNMNFKSQPVQKLFGPQLYKIATMSVALKHRGIDLFIYNPLLVDRKTKTVRGFFIKDKKLISSTQPVPQVNGNWYLGKKKIISKSGFSSLRDFLKWSQKEKIAILPNHELCSLARNKLQSVQVLSACFEDIIPRTAQYSTHISQLEEYITAYPCVFLKPNKGSRGINIVTVSQTNNTIDAVFYEKGSHYTKKFDSILHAHNDINEFIGDTDYIIQEGINCIKINNASFDIRTIMVNDSTQWNLIAKLRLSQQKSNVSNIAQGGSNHEVDKKLSEIFDDETKKMLINKIYKKSFEISHYIATLFNNTMEISFDFVISEDLKIYLIEINTAPGSSIMLKYADIFNIRDDERYIYETYTYPHSNYLSLYLCDKLLATQKGRMHDC